MALPTPVFATPPEPFAARWPETECDPVEKRGVKLFRDFVVAHQGGIVGRSTGPCGGVSGHASGRAWDWMIHAFDPPQRAKADELIDWLLRDGAEMFRRAGLRYIIWDKRVWSTLTQDWRPYDGYAPDGSCPKPPCRNPHVDHVHFSFGLEGAAGATSFYDWLRGGRPAELPVAPETPKALPVAVGFALGLAATAYAARIGRL